MSALRVLAVTKLFPNAAEPHAASFNRQQFGALGRLCALEVLATLPWFPGARVLSRWSAAGRQEGVPDSERIDELFVRHPRTLYLPKIGHPAAPLLHATSLWPAVAPYAGRVDVLLASWAYPDGVAGVWLGERLGVPTVVKVHGSDINVLGRRWWGRAMMRRVLPRAAAVVAVSRPLAEKLVDLGVPPQRVVLVPNGVDRRLFAPGDRHAARLGLGHPPEGRWIVYVGRLEEPKGVLDLLTAFRAVAQEVPDARLVLVGGGGAMDRCRAVAAELPGRVILAGPQPLPRVAEYMTAADLVTLPSWNEGTPNVLLEALASGRRIVATRVGGIPDVVSREALGRLVPARDPEALADALRRALDEPYDPATLAEAAPPDWGESARRLHDVLCRAAGRAVGLAAAEGAAA
jgi:glycosyltransferase involved in cell wall biosynthesis